MIEKTSIIWGKTKLKYEKYIICSDCHGEWWEWKSMCPDCHGSGYVKYRQQTMFGTIEHAGTCERCRKWRNYGKSLWYLLRSKRVKKTVELDIDIPPWIDDGMVIRMNWEGHDGIKASP